MGIIQLALRLSQGNSSLFPSFASSTCGEDADLLYPSQAPIAGSSGAEISPVDLGDLYMSPAVGLLGPAFCGRRRKGVRSIDPFGNAARGDGSLFAAGG